MSSPCIINVQKYCIHDGAGIRTTIFFKGCSLACQWCHNPESLDFRPQLMFFSERCRGCSVCVGVCPENCITMESEISNTNRGKCTACGACSNVCTYNARKIVGTLYTVDELVRLAEQDKMFYETSGGGITLSGGEVMLQNRNFLLELVRRLKRKGYHLTVDTCGFAPFETFEALMPYVDSFLYDIKLMDSKRHKQYTGQGNDLILSNLKKLSDSGAHLHIRIPVIEEVNSSDAEMNNIIGYLQHNIHVEKVSLLPYHNIGRDKCERIGMKDCVIYFQVPNDCRMSELAKKFKLAGFSDVQIGG